MTKPVDLASTFPVLFHKYILEGDLHKNFPRTLETLRIPVSMELQHGLHEALSLRN